MGEAKRRKAMGLAPKGSKKSKGNSQNPFIKYPRLPYILAGLGVIYLIFDLINYYKN